MDHTTTGSKQAFLDHINSADPAIKFTVKGTKDNGAIPFLDTLVKPLADNSLSISVYQKPTHTDQYLHWESHHSLSAKYSVIGTLTHRAKTICANSELLQKELLHLRNALGKCNYPPWAINRVQNKVLNNNQGDHSDNILPEQNNTNNNSGRISTSTEADNAIQYNSNQGTRQPLPSPVNKSTMGQEVIPYTKGIAKSFKHICSKYGI